VSLAVADVDRAPPGELVMTQELVASMLRLCAGKHYGGSRETCSAQESSAIDVATSRCSSARHWRPACASVYAVVKRELTRLLSDVRCHEDIGARPARGSSPSWVVPAAPEA